MKLSNLLREGITRRARGLRDVYTETYWVLYSPSSSKFLGSMTAVDSPKYARTFEDDEELTEKVAKDINDRAERERAGGFSGQPRDEKMYAPWEARELVTSYKIK